MYGQGTSREEQAQVIQGCELIFLQSLLSEVRLHVGCAQQQQRTESEIIAYATQLIINQRVRLYRAVGQLDAVIGIDHRSPRVFGHREHSREGVVAQLQVEAFGVEQDVGRLGFVGHLSQRTRLAGIADEVYVRHFILITQRSDGLQALGLIYKGKETTDFRHLLKDFRKILPQR